MSFGGFGVTKIIGLVLIICIGKYLMSDSTTLMCLPTGLDEVSCGVSLNAEPHSSSCPRMLLGGSQPQLLTTVSGIRRDLFS